MSELLLTLDDLASLLRRHGEPHWSAWLEGDARRLRNGDRGALDHLLSAFGGMGSLNDLILSPVNGHAIDEEDVERVNAELRRLASRLFTLARELQARR